MANAYQGDPYIAKAITNIGKLVFGDPSNMVKNEYYSQAAKRQMIEAQAKKQEMDIDQRASEKRSSLGDVFNRTMGIDLPGPTLTGKAGYNMPIAPKDMDLSNLVNSAATAYPDDASAVPTMYRLFAAMSGDDGLARQGIASMGGSPTEDFALTSGRADAISARDAREDRSEAFGVAGINAKSAANVAGINQAGYDRRANLDRYADPVDVSDGSSLVFNPNDPRLPKGNSNTIGSVFNNPKDVDPGSPSAKPVKPLTAAQAKKDLDAMGFLIEDLAGQVYDPQSKQKTSGPEMTASTKNQMASRAVELFTAGGGKLTPGQAAQQAFDEMAEVNTSLWSDGEVVLRQGQPAQAPQPQAPSPAAPMATKHPPRPEGMSNEAIMEQARQAIRANPSKTKEIMDRLAAWGVGS